jgi:hypothetical protein
LFSRLQSFGQILWARKRLQSVFFSAGISLNLPGNIFLRREKTELEKYYPLSVAIILPIISAVYGALGLVCGQKTTFLQQRSLFLLNLKKKLFLRCEGQAMLTKFQIFYV